MRVCLDPGHGGEDPGVMGPTGLSEAHAALTACLSLRDKLAQLGHEALLTREDDSALSEDASQDRRLRVTRANATGSEAFVSMHCGKASDESVDGISTLYARGDGFSALLAQSVQKNLVLSSGGLSDLGIVPVLGLLEVKGARVPAIVVQLGHISSRKDEALLKSADWISRAAEGIATGLAAWHSEQVAAAQVEEATPFVRRDRDAAFESASPASTEARPAEPAEAMPEPPEVERAETEAPTRQASPRPVRVVPVMQMRVDPPTSRSTERSAQAGGVLPASLPSWPAQPPTGLPAGQGAVGSVASSGPGAGTRSAAAQGVRVTTVVRTPRGKAR